MKLARDKIVVIARPGALGDGTIVRTPATTQPDLEVVAMPWWKACLVRAGRTLLQNLLGNLTNVGIGVVALDAVAGVKLPFHPFVSAFVIALNLSVAPAVYALIQNAYEILKGLDRSAPERRA